MPKKPMALSPDPQHRGTNGTTAFLKSLPCFASLPRDVIARYARRCSMKSFSPGESVYQDNGARDYTWIVRSGLLQSVALSPSGKSVTVEILRQGDFFGAVAPASGESFPHETRTILPSMIVGLPYGSLRPLLREFPEAGEWMRDSLRRQVQEAQKLRALIAERSESKVMAILLWLEAKLGAEVPFTRKMIAEAAGVATETAIRVLSPLEKKGCIQTKRGTFYIKQPERIARLLVSP